MKATEQPLTERPKSLGRWLMENKKQTQKEIIEESKNNPKYRAIIEKLKEINGQ